MENKTDILDQPTIYSGTTSSMSITKGEKMSTFKPEVNYTELKRNNISCRLCKDALNSDNYGEKITEERGYAPANSFYLAKWGFFCNPCGVEVIKAEKTEYKKNTRNLKKSIN